MQWMVRQNIIANPARYGHHPRSRRQTFRPQLTTKDGFLVQSINNAGSQQALEGNWNDENAMRKFERATDGATRQRKHEILDTKQKPNSVELRADSKPLDEQPAAMHIEALPPAFVVPAAGRQTGLAPATGKPAEQPEPAASSRFITAGAVLVVVAIICGALYLI
jgi:hypothetical protein